MSKNHQYYDLQGKGIYNRYRKTILGSLSLWRPTRDLLTRETVILSTPETNVNWKEQKDNEGDSFVEADGINTFSYDDEIVEIYSADEDKIFRRLNQKLFDKGLLVEYKESQTEQTFENALTETEVLAIASLKLPAQVQGKIKDITSVHTIQRILEKAKELGRAKTIITVLEKKLDATNNPVT